MNGNFKYTLDDEQRNRLANYLTGSKSKRLATRAEVCDFLLGALDCASTHEVSFPEPEAVTSRELPAWASDESARLRAAGHNDSYIRGWLQVMERRRSS